MKKEKPKIFVISGVRGSGKSTVIGMLLAMGRKDVRYSRSCTTRKPRADDKEWSYEYVSEDEFLRRRDAGEFAEWEKVHGNYYGTPLANLQEPGVVLLDIDVRGCARLCVILDLYESFTAVFFKASREDMRRALDKRLDMSEHDKDLSITNAIDEIEMVENRLDLYDHVFESVHGEIHDLFMSTHKVFPKSPRSCAFSTVE